MDNQQEDISDEDLLQAAEELEERGQQSGGGVSGGGVSGGVSGSGDGGGGEREGGNGAEGYFQFKRTQFRENRPRVMASSVLRIIYKCKIHKTPSLLDMET